MTVDSFDKDRHSEVRQRVVLTLSWFSKMINLFNRRSKIRYLVLCLDYKTCQLKWERLITNVYLSSNPYICVYVYIFYKERKKKLRSVTWSTKVHKQHEQLRNVVENVSTIKEVKCSLLCLRSFIKKNDPECVDPQPSWTEVSTQRVICALVNTLRPSRVGKVDTLELHPVRGLNNSFSVS